LKDNPPRRNHRRHALNRQAAIAFAAESGKPVVHTQTQDISASAVAVRGDHDDLTGATVTVLKAAPPADGKKAPRRLKIPARVVSTLRTPGMSQYRHGLEFIRSVGDGLSDLEVLLQGMQEAAPGPVAADTSESSKPSAPNRPGALRQLAQSKLAAEKEKPPKVPATVRIDEALQRVYPYLKDLVDQLSMVQYPTGYASAGVPEFGGLAWSSAHANYHTCAVVYGEERYERVISQCLLSANKQIRVDRGYPASERLKRVLTDCRIECALTESRNARGFVEHITFEFPCKVTASVLLSADVAAGKVLWHTSNVSGLGVVQ
jgi:hypothetical protein